MNWHRRRVLVTGGASFIGSHLVEKLVHLGALVDVADDLSSGRRENLSMVHKDIQLRRGDLRDRTFLDEATHNVDIVFHLAASHGGRGYIATHPADCASNMILDGMVLDSAHRAGVERVCFASSACVYPKSLQSTERNQDGKRILLSEDMADLSVEGKASPDEVYGWAKLMGELGLKAYNSQYNMKGVSCRIFTAYGPRENETHAAIALIAKAYVKMDPYVIWGTGDQDRNFTFVDDVADGLIRATERISNAEPINIGSAEHLKVKDLAQMIFQAVGFTPKSISFDLSKPEGVYSRAADLTKARKLLEWEPKTSVDKGLKKTIDWYISNHSVEDVKRTLQDGLYER